MDITLPGEGYNSPGFAMLPGNPGFDRQYQEWYICAEDAPEEQPSLTWEERWNDSYMDDREQLLHRLILVMT
jgi:hypothetical protein